MDDLELDLLGQQPRVNRLYTQLTFCFPLQDDSEAFRTQICDRLQTACSTVKEAFPWVAGHVICEDGTFKIRTQEQDKITLAVHKDRSKREPLPSFDELRNANFPFASLTEEALAPRKTMNDSEGIVVNEAVFLIQLDFLRGGLLMTFAAQHGAMDIAGMCQVIRLLANSCRGESFTDSELTVGNMKRNTIFPNLPKSNDQNHQNQTPTQTAENIVQQDEKKQMSSTEDLEWCYFAFFASSLANLKHLASQGRSAQQFISTDDALTAFVWLHLTLASETASAETGRDEDRPPAQTILTRVVDMRRHFSFPAFYPGFLVGQTTHMDESSALVAKPLGSIAEQLRSALQDEKTLDEEFWKRALPGRSNSKQAPAAKKDSRSTGPRFDVKLSSWANQSCYDVDFGDELGKPLAVRRPRFTDGAREGLVYLLPKGPDGHIMVGICLSVAVMAKLHADETFVRYGKVII